MYTCDEKEMGGVVKMSKGDALAFLQSRGKDVDMRLFSDNKKPDNS